MKQWLVVLSVGFAAAGCGTQNILLDTEGTYLLTTRDALALPQERVDLHAHVQSGDFLTGRPGYVVRFYHQGQQFKIAETDEKGMARVSFAPPAEGEYLFQAELAPVGLKADPPPPQTFLVTCRDAETPLVVVDMDKTIVATGFHTVLIGDPEPMAGSADVLTKLVQTHTLVYLTHRPDYFSLKSKDWLERHHYPTGPVLLSSLSGFLKGSGQFKTEMLQQLRSRFENIQIGIGDKISDVVAYHVNGLDAFLVLQIPETKEPADWDRLADSLADVPEQVQVVTDWDQIDAALFSGASWPRSAMQRRLWDRAQVLREQARSVGRAPTTQPGKGQP